MTTSLRAILAIGLVAFAAGCTQQAPAPEPVAAPAPAPVVEPEPVLSKY